MHLASNRPLALAHWAKALAALLVLTAALSAQSLAAFGVIVDTHNFIPPCVLFQSDDGVLAALSDDGGLPAGSRVWIEGSVNNTIVCGGLIVAQLDNTITPAFAGTGSLRRALGGPQLVTRDGHVYWLTDVPGPNGRIVFAEGRIVGEKFGGPLLEPEVFGPGHASFGRLRSTPSPSGWQLETDAGVLALQRIGISSPSEGDYVFAEGLAERARGVPEGALPVGLRANTLRRATLFAGTVVSGPDGPTVMAEADLFTDLFDVPDREQLVLGARVFVSGRALGDYDPLEDAASRVIRQATLGEAFSACGALVSEPGELPAVLQTFDGKFVELEDPGTLPHTALRYVAGRLDPAAPRPRLLQNRSMPCVSLSGRFEIGFECTPLFVVDNMGGFFSIEDPPPIPLGQPFSITGGVAICDELCPFPCIIAESIEK